MARRKLTAKQEKFCRNIVLCMTQLDAYLDAYDVSPGTKREVIMVKACELMATACIQERIAELHAAEAEKAGVTIELMRQRFEDDHAFARSQGNPSAMVKANENIAKLYGLFETRVKHTVTMRPDEARNVVSSLIGKYADRFADMETLQ